MKMLSEINSDNMDLIDDVFIDDQELIDSIINYQKGKILENEGRKLIDEAKKVFDSKLYYKKVRSAANDKVKIICTEYEINRFDSNKLKEQNPGIYKMFTIKQISKRYTIQPIINADHQFSEAVFGE